MSSSKLCSPEKVGQQERSPDGGATSGFEWPMPGIPQGRRYFFENAVHQPLGLIDPSTMLQVPFAVAELPAL
jgi:hypothetical protein